MGTPATTQRRRRQHKAGDDDLDLSRPVELVVLAVKERAVRCRLLGSGRVITLRAGSLYGIVAGHIVTVAARVFDRTLRFDPADHQGVRPLLSAMRAGESRRRRIASRLVLGEACAPGGEVSSSSRPPRPRALLVADRRPPRAEVMRVAELVALALRNAASLDGA